MRPVPGQVTASRSARTDPVRTNRPARGSRSIARLTAPRTEGTSCHSSSSSGSSYPPSATSGSAWNAAASRGRSRRATPAAWRAAVVVLQEFDAIQCIISPSLSAGFRPKSSGGRPERSQKLLSATGRNAHPPPTRPSATSTAPPASSLPSRGCWMSLWAPRHEEASAEATRGEPSSSAIDLLIAGTEGARPSRYSPRAWRRRSRSSRSSGRPAASFIATRCS
jgi:hypothetical protein